METPETSRAGPAGRPADDVTGRTRGLAAEVRLRQRIAHVGQDLRASGTTSSTRRRNASGAPGG
ncbi:hypothetical protein [Streptomyces pinistramenti]|uniref:hypothetical protein n=1 Tax=Streptomyces pinistramenti TaxID=2884812 RepID=UPI0027E5B338|nr:hypothetical protein [Streptomyces pinistramenti]